MIATSRPSSVVKSLIAPLLPAQSNHCLRVLLYIVFHVIFTDAFIITIPLGIIEILAFEILFDLKEKGAFGGVIP